MPDFSINGILSLEYIKAQGWAAAVTAAVEEVTGKSAETLVGFLAHEAHRLT